MCGQGGPPVHAFRNSLSCNSIRDCLELTIGHERTVRFCGMKVAWRPDGVESRHDKA